LTVTNPGAGRKSEAPSDLQAGCAGHKKPRGYGAKFALFADLRETRWLAFPVDFYL
jgi:hypothetical protein